MRGLGKPRERPSMWGLMRSLKPKERPCAWDLMRRPEPTEGLNMGVQRDQGLREPWPEGPEVRLSWDRGQRSVAQEGQGMKLEAHGPGGTSNIRITRVG